MLGKDQIISELNLVDQIIPKLELYYDRQVRDLPKEVLDLIKKSKFAPETTASGLEKVSDIFTDFYLAQVRLKEANENPELFAKTYANVGKTPPPAPVTPSKTKTADQTIRITLKPSPGAKASAVKPTGKILAKKPILPSQKPVQQTPPPGSQIKL